MTIEWKEPIPRYKRLTVELFTSGTGWERLDEATEADLAAAGYVPKSQCAVHYAKDGRSWVESCGQKFVLAESDLGTQIGHAQDQRDKAYKHIADLERELGKQEAHAKDLVAAVEQNKDDAIMWRERAEKAEAECERLRADIEHVKADQLLGNTEADRMRPVVEAAFGWDTVVRMGLPPNRLADAKVRLHAAVDAYRAGEPIGQPEPVADSASDSVADSPARILVNGKDVTDALHPNGRCECYGEGRCEWCKRTEALDEDIEIADTLVDILGLFGFSTDPGVPWRTYVEAFRPIAEVWEQHTKQNMSAFPCACDEFVKSGHLDWCSRADQPTDGAPERVWCYSSAHGTQREWSDDDWFRGRRGAEQYIHHATHEREKAAAVLSALEKAAERASEWLFATYQKRNPCKACGGWNTHSPDCTYNIRSTILGGEK